MSGLLTQRERSDGASALVVIVRSVNVALELAFDPFAIAPAFPCFPLKPGPSSATRKCPSELTSRFALLSVGEFENARPVIVDRAGYPGGQAGNRPTPLAPDRPGAAAALGSVMASPPGQVRARRRRHYFHQLGGVRSSVRWACAQSVKLRAGRLVTVVMSPVGLELYGSRVERNCSMTAFARSSGMP